MAEREGFEPSVEEYPQQRFSRPPQSTALPTLRVPGSVNEAWCLTRWLGAGAIASSASPKTRYYTFARTTR